MSVVYDSRQKAEKDGKLAEFVCINTGVSLVYRNKPSTATYCAFSGDNREKFSLVPIPTVQLN